MKRIHFGLTTWQKAILWIGVLVCVWRFMQVPAVFDAVLKFYAAGQVPGTDIVLTPDASLRIMLIGLLMLAALIVYITKVRSYTRKSRTAAVSTPALAVPEAIEHVAEPVAPPVVAAPKPPRGPRFVRARAFAARCRAAAIRRYRATVAFLAPRSARLRDHTRQYVRRTARAVASVARRTWVIARLAAHDFWVWFTPYAHRFDVWLRHALNSREPSATLIQFGRDMWRMAQEAWKKLEDLNRRAQAHGRD
ncbi:MAG TPA: hypothetical protein VD735_02050 [Candidatus Saccharimonadales bacterium]|nr:hypothetical protein [Candidatus Saccharimonadales bacterium]